MVGGQVNPIISVIIKNNNNNNNDDDDDDNDNNNNSPCSLNGFQHQFLKWGRRKVLTSTVAFRLQNLCGEVQSTLPIRTTSRPCRNEIVFITARVRNNSDFVLEFSCYPYYRLVRKSQVFLRRKVIVEAS